MKTIILIIMLTVGYGQETTPGWEWIDSILSREIEDAFQAERIKSSLFDDGPMQINLLDEDGLTDISSLLTLHEQYEIECYNDSSINKFWRVRYSYNFDDPPDSSWGEHRQPTFQGFIEFLKRKEKQ